ncbi:centrin [Haematococcus lacustris]|uniref:Caltractin n=1 Tax=Haematococcus lacustris TaxID=44745 RepID=A0A699ZAS3_HAELA|nr:centrin [Haematococcus lacustris]
MSSTVAAAIAQARRDKLVSRHKAGLSSDELADIRQAFELFDSDGSGGIDAQEMRVAMWALGYTVTKEQVEKMVAGMDKDGGGSIEYGEFLSLMVKQASTRSSEEDLQGVFATMLSLGPASTPGSSRTAPCPALTLAHLKAVCQEMREEVSEQDLQAMLELADLDGSGDVDVDEFCTLLMKTGVYSSNC